VCGIAGFFVPSCPRTAEESLAVAKTMGNALAHRGPDDSGEWHEPTLGLVLAHRRLSILDITQHGHQPMVSHSGRFVVSFNGEIYNFQELGTNARKNGMVFQGTSDTEVLLAVIERYGVEAALQHLVGMFAFAVWDRKQQTLSLARDRFGEKPLYYGWAASGFIFASELKALKQYPDWSEDIDRDALASFFRYGYIPGPPSIYKNTYKLPPGTSLSIRRDQASGCNYSPYPEGQSDVLKPRRYWSMNEIAAGANQKMEIDENSAIEELENRLTRAVDRQRVADVPLGALLSGGVDSSLIVALMQKISRQPVQTFTIGFSESGYNEAEHARSVAQHLGTDHTELYVAPDQAREVIPKLANIYDEPFADSSQIPTYLVSAMARSSVTVALSGDGGDELFGGYTRYSIADSIWSRLNRYPVSIRRAVARSLYHAPKSVKRNLLHVAQHMSNGQVSVTGRQDQFDRLLQIASMPSFVNLYDELIAHWKSPQSIIQGDVRQESVSYNELVNKMECLYERMMYMDTMSYLPDDILTKVDRAAMSVSLETRVPLLDHQLVEWVWGLPFHYKVRDGRTKYLLRKVLYRHVPQKLIDRPKMGFGVPLGEWLRGPLREWAEELLSVEKLQKGGLLGADPIRAIWKEHQRRNGDWHYYLWDILMFQSWRGENGD